jgi:hypothetical protein
MFLVFFLPGGLAKLARREAVPPGDHPGHCRLHQVFLGSAAGRVVERAHGAVLVV